MSKVTSKLQVTIPKAVADRYRIRPGDDVLFVPSGDTVRLVPSTTTPKERSVEARLRLFDRATERQVARQRSATTQPTERGWTREELYGRGRSD